MVHTTNVKLAVDDGLRR